MHFFGFVELCSCATACYAKHERAAEVLDLVSNNYIEIPFSHIDLGGIRCGSKSKSNSKRKGNQGLDSDSHVTGEDFGYLMNVVDHALNVGRHSMCYLTENVLGYDEAPCMDGRSAAAHDEPHVQPQTFWHQHHEEFGYRNFTGAKRHMVSLEHGSRQRLGTLLLRRA